MQEGETGMSTLRSLSKSVRMWVIAKTDAKGVRTYYNNSRSEQGEEWHVDLKFADLVEHDHGLWLATYVVNTTYDVAVMPVTLTVEEN
jgi:hypothetical protein